MIKDVGGLIIYTRKRVAKTGCVTLDKLLAGGFPTGSISLVYGEAQTGKTTLAMQCAVNSMKKGYKAIYINSDEAFSSIRFEQLAGFQSKDFFQRLLLLTPHTFQEQAKLIEDLEKYVNRESCILILDTVTSLYRVEVGSASRTFQMNKELNRQLAYLFKISKERDLAVLLTSQVHFAFERSMLEPPASRILNYWADVILQLKETDRMSIREALLSRYGGNASTRSSFFRLTEIGIRDL
jgi:DNA repair protein RadB